MKECKYCSNIENGSIIPVYESKTGTKCGECKRLLYSNEKFVWWRKLRARLFLKD